MKRSELHNPAKRSSGPMKALQDKMKFRYDVPLWHVALWTPQPACWHEIKEESNSSADQFILAAWHDDQARTRVTNFISENSDCEPGRRRLLAEAKRLYLAWIRHELRGRGCPIPWWITCAIAGMLLLWSYAEDCAMVLRCHRGL